MTSIRPALASGVASAGDQHGPACGLHRTGRDGVASRRLHVEAVHHPCGPLQTRTTEPAGQLLGAVADEEPADEGPRGQS
jgi:hypothetical protein